MSNEFIDDCEIPERCMPEVGDMIHSYKVLGRLGEGTFGVVNRVTDTASKEIYALKLLKSWELPGNERDMMMRRFKMEYETGRIQSEYLVQSKGYGKIKGNPYIIMEFCPNGDLRSSLGEPLSIENIEKTAYEMLLGLKALHENGIIHRDLKPDNVLFDETQKAKLTDFGIAGHQNVRLTKVGLFGVPKEIFGTIAYMPPEQLNPKKHAKLFTTDIFAFGVILFELFTNKWPYGHIQNHADIAEYAKKVERGEWYNIRQFREDVPDKWVQIIEKCLQPKSEQRFQTVEELLDKLEKPVINRNPVYNPKMHDFGLRIMHGEQHGTFYNLSELLNGSALGKLTLGRNDEEDGITNDINVIENPLNGEHYYISRQHATIEKLHEHKGWYIRDGQWIRDKRYWKTSLNGTYVNSEKVDENGMKLNVGDIITIGDTTLKVDVRLKWQYLS